MSFSINTLMKLRKKELIQLLINERDRADIEHDRAERLQEEIDDMETYEDEAAQLNELLKLIRSLKIAKERVSYGVSYAREEETKLLEELLDHVG